MGSSVTVKQQVELLRPVRAAVTMGPAARLRTSMKKRRQDFALGLATIIFVAGFLGTVLFL